MHVPGVPLTYRERLPNEAHIGVHALDSVPTRPGVSIHSRTQLQNYKELEVKWGYESEVHKIRTFADLRNRANRQRLGTALRPRSATARLRLAMRSPRCVSFKNESKLERSGPRSMRQSLPFCVIPSHCRIGLARGGGMPETVGVLACPSSKKRNTAKRAHSEPKANDSPLWSRACPRHARDRLECVIPSWRLSSSSFSWRPSFWRKLFSRQALQPSRLFRPSSPRPSRPFQRLRALCPGN